jgi:superfamily II DNA/RNA helicase
MAENSVQGKKRQRRGGRSRRKRTLGEAAASPKQAHPTKWNSLDVEWFGAASDRNSVGDPGKIPDPCQLVDFVNGITSAQGDGGGRKTDPRNSIQNLWHYFCKKRNQHFTKGQQFAQNHSWRPTPIQLQSWSILLPESSNRKLNLIGLSPTASGKTLAFGAPMAVAANNYVTKTGSSSSNIKHCIFGIVLVPTRELAQQVARELDVMISCFHTDKVRVLACFGGSMQSTQESVRILQNTSSDCSWLVSATPGRFHDILRKLQEAQPESFSDLIRPHYIVLDEADRLAQNSDLGKQVTSILELCVCSEVNSLALFSATYPHKVEDQWKQWMTLKQKNPCAMVRVDAVSLDASVSPRKKIKTDPSEDLEIQTDNKNAKAVHRTPPEINAAAYEIPSAIDMCGDEKERDEGGVANDEKQNKEVQKRCQHNDNEQNDFLSKIPSHLVQTLHVCAEHKKPRKLIGTLDKVRKEEKVCKSRQKRLGIVFFGKIKTLQYISKSLKKQSNHSCLELHSQLPQHVRERNIQTFQAGKVPLLLATDIAARGVHMSVAFVINYDFPGNLEQYVHRCGRAGRNYDPQREGLAKLPPTVYSFFTRSLAPMAGDLVALLQACKAWVDPNLQALLLNDQDQTSKKSKRNRPGNKTELFSQESNVAGPLETSDRSEEDKALSDEEDAFEEDAFPELSASRIVLKRAGHVSDASSSDDEDNN